MKQQRAPFGLRMPEELSAWVKQKAAEQDRSMNNFIVHVLEGFRANETATQQ
ncbi:hypothetical protein ROJ8625_00695 [Roseivivax jejudonensis]|uniref:Arc-like DNA binding domain-containing protein n=1 Tax=Roseivivax jejudonensis TaxID=1529041 RepID=A0A1X6YFF2_9RHOB|nr:Arc family DNA-binding protein [Roseivivax jejudonensis]SLN19897.1 hypothetical protein ROJ8625_00695 [Roseivivax jejudonensis]